MGGSWWQSRRRLSACKGFLSACKGFLSACKRTFFLEFWHSLFRFLPLFRFPCSLFTCSFHLLDRKRLLPPISSLRWAFLINSDCFGVGSEFGKDSCRPFEFYVGPPNISFWSPSLLSFIADRIYTLHLHGRTCISGSLLPLFHHCDLKITSSITSARNT